jgi:hypothetical protein
VTLLILGVQGAERKGKEKKNKRAINGEVGESKDEETE